MSSRVFEAKSSHRPDSPQICGLADVTGCAPIMRGEQVIYLTCRGDRATRESQVERSSATDGYATGFRVVKVGDRIVSEGTRWQRAVPVFGWEERIGDTWRPLEVWERLCHADCAREAGYRVSGQRTEAVRGRRTQGHAHRVARIVAAPIDPDRTVARALGVAVAERPRTVPTPVVPPVEGGRIAMLDLDDAPRGVSAPEAESGGRFSRLELD